MNSGSDVVDLSLIFKAKIRAYICSVAIEVLLGGDDLCGSVVDVSSSC